MIKVIPAPEPSDFDAKVRKKGLDYLRTAGIDPDSIAPEGFVFKPFWRDILDNLYSDYNGVCAYLAIFFERVAGTTSADHYLAKSKTLARDAYEWSNYRLSSIGANRKKNTHEVLDPFDIEDDWFFLDLVTGAIHPNPAIVERQHDLENTIKKLGLDDGDIKAMRARHWLNYIQHDISERHLRRHSPFVWKEAMRQGLL